MPSIDIPTSMAMQPSGINHKVFQNFFNDNDLD